MANMCRYKYTIPMFIWPQFCPLFLTWVEFSLSSRGKKAGVFQNMVLKPIF